MTAPADWLFQICMIVCAFVLSTGVAYCIFTFQERSTEIRAARQRLNDQYYQLGDINRKLTNEIVSWRYSGFCYSRVTSVRVTFGDALFELWHLQPSIQHGPLAEMASTLEDLIIDFNEEISAIMNYDKGQLVPKEKLSSIEPIMQKIERYEAVIRDEYREWLEKPALSY